MLQSGRSRVLSPHDIIGFFSIDLILPAHYGPGVDSVSNRNEYQEYSWGVLLLIASGMGLNPLYCGHFWPIVPAPDDRLG
jgi:hypothetical protein